MGWQNDQATNLDGQAVTYTNSTTEYATGSALTVDSDATFTVNGLSPALGIVGRFFSATDLPAAGTTVTGSGTAATVGTVTVPSTTLGRIYLISAPALEVRMNVAARSGVQLTYTEDGTAPGPTSTLLGSMVVNCPTAGSPEPAPFGITYTRRSASGPLRVLLSIWNVSGGGSTVASGGNASGLGVNNVVELLVTDMGIDPAP